MSLVARWIPATLGVAAAVVAAAVAIAAAPGGVSSRQPTSPELPATASERLRRGGYLVHQVAMCPQCHSPRDERGQLIAGQLLQGGPIPARSTVPGLDLAFLAPRLAGHAAGLDRPQFVHLLMTGVRPDGSEPRYPMPPFQMSREDAEAIYEYLMSLR